MNINSTFFINVAKTVLLGLLLGLVSCGQKKTQENSIYSINSLVVLGTPSSVNLSEIAESVSFIALETHDDALIDQWFNIEFADSLLILNSSKSGVLIFDAGTGKYLYKIAGFRDRGPLGYGVSDYSLQVVTDLKNKILLSRGTGIYGIWDYKTGKILNPNLSFSQRSYQTFFFINDSLLVGNTFYTRLNTSMIDLLSTSDGGGIIREYGFQENIDKRNHAAYSDRVRP